MHLWQARRGSRSLDAFSKILHVARLGWHLALSSGRFSGAKSTPREKKDAFSSEHFLRVTQQEFFLLYV